MLYVDEIDWEIEKDAVEILKDSLFFVLILVLTHRS
jgi:hypothetical protein